jgi:hypothetical protein
MFNNYSGNMLSLTRVNSGHNNQPTEALTQSPTSSVPLANYVYGIENIRQYGN